MNPVTIMLVINLTIAGQDVTNSEPMTSLTECWKQARIAMAEAVVIPNKGPDLRVLRIGCFATIQPTPPT